MLLAAKTKRTIPITLLRNESMLDLVTSALRAINHNTITMSIRAPFHVLQCEIIIPVMTGNNLITFRVDKENCRGHLFGVLLSTMKTQTRKNFIRHRWYPCSSVTRMTDDAQTSGQASKTSKEEEEDKR